MLRITDRGNQRRGGHRADAWRGGETLADLIAPMPTMKTFLQLIDPSTGIAQLIDHRGQNRACHIGQTAVAIVSDDRHQLLHILDALGDHDPEL